MAPPRPAPPPGGPGRRPRAARRRPARAGRRPGREPSWPPAPVTQRRRVSRSPVPIVPGASPPPAPGPAAAPTRPGWPRTSGPSRPAPPRSAIGRLPTELGADLGAVEQVAPVVAGTVGDDLLERRGLARGRRARRRRSPRCSPRRPLPDVVGLADPAPLEDGLDGPAVVDRRAATRAGSWSTRRAAAAGRRGRGSAKSGITFSGNW